MNLRLTEQLELFRKLFLNDLHTYYNVKRFPKELDSLDIDCFWRDDADYLEWNLWVHRGRRMNFLQSRGQCECTRQIAVRSDECRERVAVGHAVEESAASEASAGLARRQCWSEERCLWKTHWDDMSEKLGGPLIRKNSS